MQKQRALTSAMDLVTSHRLNTDVFGCEKIIFQGTDDDVYNISAPFDSLGKTYIAGRIEPRNSEVSAVGFFKATGAVYVLDQTILPIPLFQDPAVQTVNGMILIGGTAIRTDQHHQERITGWNTAFYAGIAINQLVRIADAPNGMKDVRVIGYKNRIAVFTRPQGGLAGPGKIGFVMFDTLADLSPQTIAKAVMLHDHFCENEWGGANALEVLANGWIGVLGHISRRDHENRLHYAAMTFAFNPFSLETRGMKVIAERRDFVSGPAKREDLHDVIFPGGLIRQQDSKAILYAGVSDCEAHRLWIRDPFLEYEQYEEVTP